MERVPVKARSTASNYAGTIRFPVGGTRFPLGESRFSFFFPSLSQRFPLSPRGKRASREPVGPLFRPIVLLVLSR